MKVYEPRLVPIYCRGVYTSAVYVIWKNGDEGWYCRRCGERVKVVEPEDLRSRS